MRLVTPNLAAGTYTAPAGSRRRRRTATSTTRTTTFTVIRGDRRRHPPSRPRPRRRSSPRRRVPSATAARPSPVPVGATDQRPPLRRATRSSRSSSSWSASPGSGSGCSAAADAVAVAARGLNGGAMRNARSPSSRRSRGALLLAGPATVLAHALSNTYQSRLPLIVYPAGAAIAVGAVVRLRAVRRRPGGIRRSCRRARSRRPGCVLRPRPRAESAGSGSSR